MIVWAFLCAKTCEEVIVGSACLNPYQPKGIENPLARKVPGGAQYQYDAGSGCSGGMMLLAVRDGFRTLVGGYVGIFPGTSVAPKGGGCQGSAARVRKGCS